MNRLEERVAKTAFERAREMERRARRDLAVLERYNRMVRRGCAKRYFQAYCAARVRSIRAQHVI